jgi:hypothetical protein
MVRSVAAAAKDLAAKDLAPVRCPPFSCQRVCHSVPDLGFLAASRVALAELLYVSAGHIFRCTAHRDE